MWGKVIDVVRAVTDVMMRFWPLSRSEESILAAHRERAQDD